MISMNSLFLVIRAMSEHVYCDALGIHAHSPTQATIVRHLSEKKRKHKVSNNLNGDIVMPSPPKKEYQK